MNSFLNQSKDTQLYDLLNVSPTASESEIKKAYRKAALKFHPDKNKDPGAEEKFKEISMAWDILSNPEKKNTYDNFGLEAVKGQQQMGGAPDINPMNIFESMFGSGYGANMFGGLNPRREQVLKTQDRIETMDVSLSDIYNQKKSFFIFSKKKICNECSGIGAVNKKSIIQCNSCNGTGKIIKILQIGPGMISQSQKECSECEGRGKIIPERFKCRQCLGKKVRLVKNKVTIQLTKKMRNKEKIVFTGEADQHPDAKMYGDLVVILNVQPDPVFKVRNNDLHIEKSISLVQALTGLSLRIKLPDKSYLYVKNQETTQPGDMKRLVGYGLEGEGEVGDIVVKFLVVLPKNINQKRKEYLTKLLPIGKDIVEPKEGDLFPRIMEYYEETQKERLYEEKEQNDQYFEQNNIECNQQ